MVCPELSIDLPKTAQPVRFTFFRWTLIVSAERTSGLAVRLGGMPTAVWSVARRAVLSEIRPDLE